MNLNVDKPQTFIEFLPISIFGAVMGLCGLCFSWRLAQKMWGLGYLTAELIGFLAIGCFIALTCAYVAKIVTYPSAVKKEFSNSVSVCFFATFIVSLLLMPGILLPYFRQLATGVWTLGTILMFLFAWYVLRKWIDNQQKPEDALPIWVLPVVGTLDVPIVGLNLQNDGIREICLLFFGIGLVFTFILLPVVFSRILFQKPIPISIQPTLLILTGPLSLAFSCYERLTGTQDIAASVFFYFNIFLLLLLGSKIFLIPKTCPFQVSWWSVSFPLVAITIAAFHYAEHQPDLIHQGIAGILLVLSTLIITYLFAQTLYLIVIGKFVPVE
ncbi:SLAC1 anion channel family protein [Dyadobacter sp. 3J3]|uniref:SLAC1 anion channel family protein n=1 Tax=Dyadobacter sp. 3J3 TaxID=2606600 RepID=UPI001358AFEE|nr:SLAC1 anion channel family protein [Dyadobacter sp. 3J3]